MLPNAAEQAYTDPVGQRIIVGCCGFPYVLFNNASMLEDARRFQSLVSDSKRPS